MPIYFPPVVSVTTSVSGADPGASYVVMTTTSSLTNERALTAGTGFLLADGGVGGNVTFAINDNIVATISGTTFTGPVSASNGLSGSLQQISQNLSYLVAGTNMTVTSQSNGQIILASTATGGSGGGADPGASYVVMGTTASLMNERALAAGTGLTLADAGAGSTATFTINDNTVATVSGTTFTGVVSASAGLSGSLQRIGPNLSYLVAGQNISITSQSNGQIVISSSLVPNGGTMTLVESKIVASATGSLSFSNLDGDSDLTYFLIWRIKCGAATTYDVLPNGLTSNMGQMAHVASSVGGHAIVTSYTVPRIGDVDNGSVLSGQMMIYPQTGFERHFNSVDTESRVSGGTVLIWQRTTRWINTTTNITSLILSSGNASGIAAGSVVYLYKIANTSGGTVASTGADPYASYVVMGTTSSLPNERALTAGTGLTLTDAGIGSTAAFAINNNTVATVSGTTFTGVVSASAGLSGSLQQVGPGLSYLVGGSNTTITSQSNGQIIIANTLPPGYKLIETINVTGAAVTSVTFSNLNGDVDQVYQLVYWDYVVTAHRLDVQPNAATSTYVNGLWYYASNGGSGLVNTYTSVALIDGATGDYAFGTVTIYATSGVQRAFMQSGGWLRPGGTTLNGRWDSSSRWTNTADNITSFKIVSSAASGIGVGSRFSLYKVTI